MYVHLFRYQLSGLHLFLMLLGMLLAYITGVLLDRKRKAKKVLTLFFAIAVFALDYFSYVPGWSWVARKHSSWNYFESWLHLFYFFELVLLPFDIGFLLSWLGDPGILGKNN